MAELTLRYPVKPISINQGFGTNADYYARFRDDAGNPEKGHNGIDLFATHGEPVYAPCDGLAFFVRDSHGGEGIYIRTGLFDYKGGQAKFNIVLWHLVGDTDVRFPSPIPLDGKMYPVKTGDLVGYADNTGFPFESSGDHLHLGLQPLNQFNTIIDQNNGFNGCVDPLPFFDGTYAQDTRRDESYIAGLLAAAWAMLKAKYPGRSAPPPSPAA